MKIKRHGKKKPGTISAEPRAEISIAIDLPSLRLTDIMYSTLLPETRETAGFRSRTKISKDDRALRLDITAADIVALRAATNTFLRFVSVAMKALNVVSPFYTADKPAAPQPTTGK